jgi:hypothetical protein
MFEINMDEYLDEEVESANQKFDVICKAWDRQVRGMWVSATFFYRIPDCATYEK